MKTDEKSVGWNDFKNAYELRSAKYENGKYLGSSRKSEGISEYLDLAVEKARTNLDGEKIKFCDAGCGNGIYLKYLKNKFPGGNAISLNGFDFAERIVSIARENTELEEIKVGNLECAPYGNEEFDIILCSQVVEHLLDDKKGMKELNRMLKSGGWLVLSTDNRNNIVSKILNTPYKILSVPISLIKKIIGDKKYFPHKNYSLNEFRAMIENAGFKIQKFSTFRFSLPFPFYKVSFLNSALDFVEKFCARRGWFKNNGDIVIALAEKK